MFSFLGVTFLFMTVKRLALTMGNEALEDVKIKVVLIATACLIIPFHAAFHTRPLLLFSAHGRASRTNLDVYFIV